MSLVPADQPKENSSLPRQDWGRFGEYATEDGLPGDDRLSPELSRRTVTYLLGILVAIIAAVLTVRIAGPTGNITWLILVTAGITGFALLWRNFEWSVIGYICIAWMVLGTPDVAQGGSGASQKVMVSQAGLMVLIVTWCLQKLLSQRLTLYRSPVNIPIFAYLTFAAWSTVNSLMYPNPDVLAHSPKTYLQVNVLEYGMRFLALMGVFLLGDVLRGKYLRYAAVALLIPGVATFSGLLWFIPFTSYQAFAQVLAMSVLAAFTLLDKGPLWQRIVSGSIVLAIFFVYFVRNAEWVSGWLGAIIALTLILWRVNRKLLFSGAAVVALIVVLNFPYFYRSLYASNFYATRERRIDETILPWQHFHHGAVRHIFEEQGQFSNDRSRMLYASSLYASHFPLGIGLGNYRAYNLWFGLPENWDTSTFTSAHGTYAQVISETGWGGFALFMWLLYSNASLMNKVYKRLPSGRWKIYALGGWAGCIGIYCASFNGDYVFPAYHNGGLASFGACVYTHLMVGICLAIAREKGATWDSGTPPLVSGKWSARPTFASGDAAKDI